MFHRERGLIHIMIITISNLKIKLICSSSVHTRLFVRLDCCFSHSHSLTFFVLLSHFLTFPFPIQPPRLVCPERRAVRRREGELNTLARLSRKVLCLLNIFSLFPISFSFLFISYLFRFPFPSFLSHFLLACSDGCIGRAIGDGIATFCGWTSCLPHRCRDRSEVPDHDHNIIVIIIIRRIRRLRSFT